jgi:acyl carrier protein
MAVTQARCAQEKTMNAQTIEARLVEFLRSVTGNPALDGSSQLLEDGIVDSLTMMDLMVLMETDFAVRLDFSDLNAENFRTAATLASLIAQRQAQPRQADAA